MTFRKTGLITIILLIFSGLFRSDVLQAQEPSTSIWSRPIQLSQENTLNWYPDIVVDYEGHPHVIWDGGLAPNDKLNQPKAITSLIMHTRFDGKFWTQPLNVVARFHKGYTLDNVPQASLNLDGEGNLLLFYGGNLYRASAKTAHQSAVNWSDPFPISREILYGGSVVMDRAGVLHALYDGPAFLEEAIGQGITKLEYLSDIFYRRSLDGGQTWSAPLNVSQTQIGESDPRLEVDEQGLLYASWIQGWDRHVEEGRVKNGVLIISQDGGLTWSDPSTFSFPEETNSQLDVISDNQGGVMAVWRPMSHKAIMYSWSGDGGASWTIPRAIPFIFARVAQDTPYDSFDMTVDSNGVIHLAMVGRVQANRVLSQLYHVSWDGKTWSNPALIFEGQGWPESPRITISQGNQLHAVWFMRDQLELAYHTYYQIWYSQATIDAPEEPLPATPTPRVAPVGLSQPEVNLTPTVPKFAVSEAELAAIQGIHTGYFGNDSNLPLLLTKSLAPLLIGVSTFGAGRYLVKRMRRN